MLTQFGACPVCLTQIPAERLNQGIHVCQACGWTDSRRDDILQNQIDSTMLRVYVTLSVLTVSLFIHTVNWDKHSLAIVPLKAKQYAGMANSQDLLRIAEICKERQKPECIEGAYHDLVAQNPQNLEHLALYGKILVQTEKRELAVSVYSNYFTLGGKDTDVAFEFARALGETGRIEDSIKYFRYVLDSKPETLQISVTHAFVNMLLKNKRYTEAREVIESTRKMGENTALFMEDKLQEIARLTTAAG